MAENEDWRLTNQQKYLGGVSLVFHRYEPTPGNDHDHCEFCWAEFMVRDYPDVLHEGYSTLDNYHWICEPCFKDFADRFDWQILPDATSTI